MGNIIFTEINKYVTRPLKLNNGDLKIVRKMKKEEDILLIQTDKSNRIAIIDQVAYNNKMLKAIKEMNCTLIEKCPLNKINKKLKDILVIGQII